MKDTICVAVGLVGGFFTAIFGGWDSALVTLVVFMAIDFFTGIITAMMKKSKHTESGGLSSKAGWFGLAKKVCTLTLIVVACLLYTSPSPRDLSTSRMPSSA